MYYPYLRARQFELIALRELALENSLTKIIPVLEPVKESINNLSIANKVFTDKLISPYLIVNPLHGEKSGDTDYYLNYISKLYNSKYKQAFLYSNNREYITSMFDKYNISDSMIISLGNISDEKDFIDLCKDDRASHIMLLEPNKYRGLDRDIKKLEKTYIRLDDSFEKQTRNADYLDLEAHKFTEEHFYYTEDSYQGFSDFTVLSSEYTEGGSMPRAVVIHITYDNNDYENQIWIRHFTSETNDSVSNVQGKFIEAAEKAVAFFNEFNLNNTAINELVKFATDAKYPGLGTVKKISIKNHLLVIESILN